MAKALEIDGFGLVGCGQLGGAIGRTLLRSGLIEPSTMWIANRSGRAAGFNAFDGLRWTTDIQELADRCAVIVLALPPAAGVKLAFAAPDTLVVSVMAGITSDQLIAMSGSRRVVRAMSNPAAENAMAYSPWFAAPDVTVADKAIVTRLFEACGVTDDVPVEDQIDCFTAVTGPVPGFVAMFADAMVRYAVTQGIEPKVAERAVRQLFLAGGHLLSQSDEPASAHVQAMIDYAGTTAAGLLAMRAAGIDDAVVRGLEAARLKTLAIGKPPA
ncbi:MAG TPA: pyrroline-5-carboxylate reductase dimerization domain-containing protein [Ancylobacter sp.]